MCPGQSGGNRQWDGETKKGGGINDGAMELRLRYERAQWTLMAKLLRLLCVRLVQLRTEEPSSRFIFSVKRTWRQFLFCSSVLLWCSGAFCVRVPSLGYQEASGNEDLMDILTRIMLYLSKVFDVVFLPLNHLTY